MATRCPSAFVMFALERLAGFLDQQLLSLCFGLIALDQRRGSQLPRCSKRLGGSAVGSFAADCDAE
jgi:hypothetical protein